MFTYFHCYMPQVWEAQIRRGLVDGTSGIRFSQSLTVDEDLKFNRLAAKNSLFYNTVKDMMCPLYIDRLQGGCYIENYDYDENLLDEYRNMLGNRFWGFQMHEWMSNIKSDIYKIISNGCTEWTEDNIIATIKKAFPFKHLFLESMTAEEFAENGNPQSAEEFLAQAVKMFRKRSQRTKNQLIPCDSSFLAPKVEFENGARRLMPELGAQTMDTRVQLSYTRGMSKAYKIPFGAYYEPWGGSPFSACCYQKDNLNEWGIGSSDDFPFVTCGDNGGSSRSLQKRIHLYSYLAGAQFISEEWGMCNTFRDWNDFELSPYGQIKYDFLNFVKKYNNIGTILTPIAAVLPKDIQVLENIHSNESVYLGFNVTGNFAEKLKNARIGIRNIFSSAESMIGTESTSMINSKIPDSIDILHEDNVDALKQYEYLIDLSGNPEFAINRSNICDADDVPGLLERLLPCTVSGGLHWLVTFNGEKYYLAIFNNSGISRTVADGEIQLSEAEQTVCVKIKEARNLSQLEGSKKIAKDEENYYITIAGGDWFFGEF